MIIAAKAKWIAELGAEHDRIYAALVAAGVTPIKGNAELAVQALTAANGTARTVIEGCVEQFAGWSEVVGGYSTGGLSALEEAFDWLGWEDPHPAPEARCQTEGCLAKATLGIPTPSGYKRLCHAHCRLLDLEA